jgi:hypothetical protein
MLTTREKWFIHFLYYALECDTPILEAFYICGYGSLTSRVPAIFKEFLQFLDFRQPSPYPQEYSLGKWIHRRFGVTILWHRPTVDDCFFPLYISLWKDNKKIFDACHDPYSWNWSVNYSIPRFRPATSFPYNYDSLRNLITHEIDTCYIVRDQSPPRKKKTTKRATPNH